MKSRLNINVFIVIMGLLWGVTELTAGYLLHLLYIPVAGALLMPVGVLCMAEVYGGSGRKSSMLLVSLIAASVKLITFLFVPASGFHLVINPVAAILLQGLILTLPLTVMSDIVSSPKTSFGKLLFVKRVYVVPLVFGSFYTAIVIYKLAFITFQGLLKMNTGAPVLGGFSIAENYGFLFVETLISAVIITGYLLLKEMIFPVTDRVKS